MRSLATSFAAILAFAASTPSVLAQLPNLPPGVIATGTQGPTNPPQPTLGTAINQTSYSRLLSVNSIDDFCLFAPPQPGAIADTETIEVAWCTKARNNARVIPDGTITGVSFLKNDYYIQLIGYGDFTQLNIPFNDWGGELDPHGAYGAGNPVGGNVTSDISGGTDVPYAEWMLYIDYNQFCLRVCTNANSTYSAANMCWHELDEMGCQFVMPGNYNVNGTFETCDADVAYPPGWYPTATVDGTVQFSQFAQRYTGTLSDGSVYTVGDLSTPAAPYFTPSSSNCVTTSTIANNIALASLGVTGGHPAATGGPAASGPTRSGGASGSQPTGAGANSAMGVRGNLGLIALTVLAGYLFH